jgi:alpha-D-ribose 1-methylphosphonate 5-triphosphate diphosphatase PhnM
MLPLVISGVFLAGLLALKNMAPFQRGWHDEREYQKFMRERERWSMETVRRGFFQY